MTNKLTTAAFSFLIVALLVYTLVLLRGILIPFIIAFVIAYFIISLHQTVQSFWPFKSSLPRPVSISLAIIILIFLLYILFTIISTNIASFIQQAPAYQTKFQDLIDRLIALFDLKPSWRPSALFKNFDFVSIASQGALLLTDIASNTGMIFLYLLFFMVEYSHFDQKLGALCRLESRKQRVDTLLEDILAQIQKYMKVKILTSLLTATCSYIVLISVGVAFPVLWATLIFIFNFIPTIGSILATFFPCVLALVQFDSFIPFIAVSISLSLVQMFIGNIVEPRVMGRSFNLSGLMIIFSLSLWYAIWGVIGMFLCIPITVIISIVLANFPETRWIAILLSQTGLLEENENKSLRSSK